MQIAVTDLQTNNTFTGKMVIYVNGGNSTTNWLQPIGTVKDSYTYNFNPATTLSFIPMWGVKEINNMTMNNGQRYDIGDIYLLRSMAKVTVKLTDEMVNRGYTLDDVTLNNYTNTGYVVPSTTDVSSTELLTFDQSFHPSAASLSNGSLNFTMATSSTTTTSLYIPEYDNSESAPTTITVRVKRGNGTEDGDIRTATFRFGSYTDGNYTSAVNIVRNHHYVFNVYGDPIKINLEVEPWTVFEHDPYTI